jgi:hypothetical protein
VACPPQWCLLRHHMGGGGCLCTCAWRMCANGHSCPGARGYHVENILFAVFLCMLSEKETCPHNMCLPLLRCEAHLISVHLPSTCACTVYMFSPTSPTRTHAHQVLNPRQWNTLYSTRFILHRKRVPVGTHAAHVCQRARVGAARLITWSCPFAWDTRPA